MNHNDRLIAEMRACSGQLASIRKALCGMALEGRPGVAGSEPLYCLLVGGLGVIVALDELSKTLASVKEAKHD